MHSSRMRTAHVSRGGRSASGGGGLHPGGRSASRGEVCIQGVCILGVCIQRGVYIGGVCIQRGSTSGGGRPLFPMNRMTDRCKNITLRQTSFASGKGKLCKSSVASKEWLCQERTFPPDWMRLCDVSSQRPSSAFVSTRLEPTVPNLVLPKPEDGSGASNGAGGHALDTSTLLINVLTSMDFKRKKNNSKLA